MNLDISRVVWEEKNGRDARDMVKIMLKDFIARVLSCDEGKDKEEKSQLQRLKKTYAKKHDRIISDTMKRLTTSTRDGESLQDTGRVLEQMNLNALLIPFHNAVVLDMSKAMEDNLKFMGYRKRKASDYVSKTLPYEHESLGSGETDLLMAEFVSFLRSLMLNDDTRVLSLLTCLAQCIIVHNKANLFILRVVWRNR